MVMCQGRRCRSICLYLALIAVAIQGLTPDAHDLASLNSLRVLCPAFSDSTTLPSDDGLPDEVCGPMTFEMDLVSRTRSDSNSLTTLAYLASDESALALPSGARRSRLGSCHIVRADAPLHCLCRLNC